MKKGVERKVVPSKIECEGLLGHGRMFWRCRWLEDRFVVKEHNMETMLRVS
jgi:hypothetical protein